MWCTHWHECCSRADAIGYDVAGLEDSDEEMQKPADEGEQRGEPAEKVALDEYYLRNASLWLDLRIILLTVWKVIRRDGISH